MKIERLKLKNFKGIRDLEISPRGASMTIYGDNATGKTTIADAICYLLFDKDSHGQKGFAIKTIVDGKEVTGLEHTVEGDFSTADGEISLSKTFVEVWTQKRGQATKEFTGHRTDYTVDGVPVQQKEYQARVAKIADPELFRLLTQPDYFPEQLPWQKRRSILLEVCGEVSDQDVIASSDELRPLGEIIAGRKMDDHKKVVAASMKKINDELKQIPVRIDELARQTIGDDNNIDLAANQEQERKAALAIDRLKAQIAQADAGSEAAALKKELAEAEAAVLDIENQHRRDVNEIAAEKERELSAAKIAFFTADTQLSNAKLEAELLAKNVPVDTRPEILADIEKLRAEWYEADAMAYRPEEKVCPTCGQDVPEADDAEERFSRRRAERLAGIDARGEELKVKLVVAGDVFAASTQDRLDMIDNVEKRVAELKETATEAANSRDILAKEIEAIRARPVTGREDHKDAVALVTVIKVRLGSVQAGDTSGEQAAHNQELERLTDLLVKVRQRIGVAEARDRNSARIEELKAEEKRLAGEYERLAGELYLMEQFTRAKVDMLEERINSSFALARFRLFEEQINGGLAECCEVTYNGVPYSSGLNNGARVNVGLDIIRTLSRHYGVSMPVIIDNAESVTDLLPTGGQEIRLVVSAADTSLRIVGEA